MSIFPLFVVVVEIMGLIHSIMQFRRDNEEDEDVDL